MGTRWGRWEEIQHPVKAPGWEDGAQGSALVYVWGRVRESCVDLSVPAPQPKGCFSWGSGQGSHPPMIVCTVGSDSALGTAGCPLGLGGSDLGLSDAFAPLWCHFLVSPALPPYPMKARRGSGQMAFNGKTKDKTVNKAATSTTHALPSSPKPIPPPPTKNKTVNKAATLTTHNLPSSPKPHHPPNRSIPTLLSNHCLQEPCASC